MDQHEASAQQPFSGYYKNKVREVDDELARVGPGTPAGEYFRRYWHPILMTERLGAAPYPLRVLGEDLVLFRNGSGEVGLVDRYCSHRGMSLEFGIIEPKGIRCAYHGWCFANDGRTIDTPGEPPSSRMKERVRHGAYKVREHRGLIFAYFGPPALEPPFPFTDMMALADNDMVPWQIHSPCNWLQIAENNMDPFHTPFLHTRMTGVQFENIWGELPVIDYHRRPNGFFYTNARRNGDNIWIRLFDHLLPNFSQNGGLFERGDAIRYFGRTSLTRWVVPIDDTNTWVIAWRNLNQRDDPEGRSKRDEIGWEKVDFYGQTAHRSHDQRITQPGDWDAWVGQGPINSHARENLGSTDQGVALLRRLHRETIRNLQKGIDPPPFVRGDGVRPIATHGGDTVLRVPARPGGDDRALILEVSKKVAQAYLDTAEIDDDGERRSAIERLLAPVNEK